MDGFCSWSIRCICLRLSTQIHIHNANYFWYITRSKTSILNGFECNDAERKLFKAFQIEFENFKPVTQTAVEKVKNQDKIYDKSIKKVNRNIMRKLRNKNLEEIVKNLNRVSKLVDQVGWTHCRPKIMVYVWTKNHYGIAYISDIIFPSNAYHHFVFLELHSSLNMLCHVQKVYLCQSGITKLETSQLNCYPNAANNKWNSTTISNWTKWSSCRCCSSVILG